MFSRSYWLNGGLSALYSLCIFNFAASIVLWFTVNSDRNYIHPILSQLIPAGHCACETAAVFECSTCLTCSHQDPILQIDENETELWEFEYSRDAFNVGLSRSQCAASFPGLFEDVSRAATYWSTQGGLSSDDLDAIPINQGMGRARITQGELYVISVRARGEDHRRKILAALSTMHRALVADSNRLARPEIEFVFSIEDKLADVTSSEHPVWALARTADEEAAWLMPDFGYWAWDHLQASIGPYDQVVEQAAEYDNIPWENKKHQLVWRGKPSFAPKLRRALMDATRDQPWADVQAVDWQEHDKSNVLKMEDHCKYMFIAHVEGRSYSASLKYRQACRSVIVVHQLQYIQHHHYLLIPSGPQQNFVEVARDFSDLADALKPLLEDPVRAETIANNSVRTFRQRYLTPAAEACYWRALWDEYGDIFNSSQAQTGEERKRRPGLRYESFILQGSDDMLEFNS
ncbi:glycosyl transferase family 90-domain-containing protein [Aspergillus tetrazonus]